jgi:hypothetical protein
MYLIFSSRGSSRHEGERAGTSAPQRRGEEAACGTAPGLMPATYPAAIPLFPFPKWGVGIPLRIHLPFMEDGHAVEAGQFR